jgi:urease accessory protein UreF
MTVGINSVPSSPAELLGDPHPLLEQLGSGDDLALAGTVAALTDFQGVASVPALRSFLDAYRAQILVPIELPAIVAAYHHAVRGEARELIELDQRLRTEVSIQKFAVASYRVGQRQLSKLRPMRDQRLVQRYLGAIEEGRAHGWHTLVYGVSLAMFSLALRQGLQHYMEQTVRGFVESTSKTLHLGVNECDSVVADQMVHLPASVAAALNPMLA